MVFLYNLLYNSSKGELMDKNTNELLMLGVTILIMGLLLFSYSISCYKESRELASKIDFEELDYNNQISTSDKYFKYLSNADYLNQHIKKNKNILIKNSSCIYLDYAQHNAISLYKLTYSGIQTDESRRNVAAGNVRALYNMLDDYKTCKQAQNYKAELKNILDDIQKTDDLYSQREKRMESFMKVSEDNANALSAQGLETEEADNNVSESSMPNPETNNYAQPVDESLEY